MIDRSFYSSESKINKLKSSLKDYQGSIYLHWDFIYIPTRYLMLRYSVKQQLLKKLADFYRWASEDLRVKGIVMHTDYPLRYEVLQNYSESSIEKYYSKSMYDTAVIKKLSPLTICELSIKEFYKDIKKCLKSSCPIFLENTCKVYKETNSYNTICNLIQHLSDVYKMCLDTEHYFAVEGVYPDFLSDFSNSNLPNLVHLNTIPASVRPKSRLDRHSTTTIFDCSVHSPQDYISLSSNLQSVGIDCIRELDYQFVLKEIEQLNHYNE